MSKSRDRDENSKILPGRRDGHPGPHVHGLRPADLTGTIITLNRLTGTITIRQTQGGTVGASTGGATDEYKVQDRPQLENWHAGDKVTFAVSEGGGATITKLEKPKP